MEMAVADGVELGWNRAHKHNDEPEPEQIQASILDAVTAQICEWFIFEGESDDGTI
jgi:hypothetical protein